MGRRLHADVLDPNCASRKLLDTIGDRWSAIVMLLLDREGPTRFNELARLVDGISFKVLTSTLRRLERDGLVARRVESTRPPSVTYALTPLGETLLPVLHAIRTWAEAKVPAVLRAREAYDRREPAA